LQRLNEITSELLVTLVDGVSDGGNENLLTLNVVTFLYYIVELIPVWLFRHSCNYLAIRLHNRSNITTIYDLIILA
jgi:hypothetical protein